MLPETTIASWIKECKSTLFDHKFWITNLSLIIGSFLFAYAINISVLPLNMVAPGISGIAVVIYYITGISSVGVIYFLLNIPIFLLGWRQISAKLVFISLLGTLYLAMALEISSGFTVPAVIADEPYLMIFLGAMLNGIGAGLYLRYGGSVGGLDIVAYVAKKKIGIPIGATFTVINCINLLLNLMVQDLKTTLLSTLYIFLMVFFTVKTQSGFSQRSVVFIISAFYQQISEKLNEKLERSSTFLKTVGSYSKTESHMVYTIINLTELGRLKEIVYNIDPKALISVFETTEVIGQKFITWEADGYTKKKKSSSARKRS